MIHFRNPGEIDIRALTTFGLSSKDESKIGRFGTGLKYATAVILREGGTMRICTGNETFEIGSKVDTFRGKEVTQITMNGDPLPFTADLGRDWEPWMAFRELYANALDEGGEVARTDDPAKAEEDKTTISVDLAKFEAIYFSMEEHFISADEEPIWASDSIEVYPGRSLFVFYRGIAIMKLKEPAAYRYNLLGYVDLTEDRTAKYTWQVEGRIARALAETMNTEIAEAATDNRNTFEADLDFSNEDASEVFIGATVNHGANANPTAMARVKAQLPTDASEATVISKAQPGGETLIEALKRLRGVGADLSKCKFVLAEGITFYGDFEVRGDAVFLNQSIFENQDKMTLACLLGYDGVVGNKWLARKLLSVTEKAAA